MRVLLWKMRRTIDDPELPAGTFAFPALLREPGVLLLPEDRETLSLQLAGLRSLVDAFPEPPLLFGSQECVAWLAGWGPSAPLREYPRDFDLFSREGELWLERLGEVRRVWAMNWSSDPSCLQKGFLQVLGRTVRLGVEGVDDPATTAIRLAFHRECVPDGPRWMLSLLACLQVGPPQPPAPIGDSAGPVVVAIEPSLLRRHPPQEFVRLCQLLSERAPVVVALSGDDVRSLLTLEALLQEHRNRFSVRLLDTAASAAALAAQCRTWIGFPTSATLVALGAGARVVGLGPAEAFDAAAEIGGDLRLTGKSPRDLSEHGDWQAFRDQFLGE